MPPLPLADAVLGKGILIHDTNTLYSYGSGRDGFMVNLHADPFITDLQSMHLLNNPHLIQESEQRRLSHVL